MSGRISTPVGVAPAGGLERLVPPRGPFQQRRADRLGDAGIQVVDDRLDRLEDGRGGIPGLEPVAGDEPLRERLADRRGVVLVVDPEISRPGIVRTRLVARFRRGHERVALADGDRLRRGGHLAHPRPRPVAGERQHDLDLGVSREPLRARQMDRAPRRVDAELSLTGAAQRFERPERVGEEELGGVDQDAPVGLGGDLEAGDHRRGERLLDRPRLGRVVAHGAEPVVGLDQQRLRAVALEPDDPGRAELVAVDADVVRPHPGRHRHHVDQLLAGPRDLQPQLPLARVPVERQEPVDRAHPGGLRLDGRERGRGRAPVPVGRRRRASGRQQADEEPGEGGTEHGASYCRARATAISPDRRSRGRVGPRSVTR